MVESSRLNPRSICKNCKWCVIVVQTILFVAHIEQRLVYIKKKVEILSGYAYTVLCFLTDACTSRPVRMFTNEMWDAWSYTSPATRTKNCNFYCTWNWLINLPLFVDLRSSWANAFDFQNSKVFRNLLLSLKSLAPFQRWTCMKAVITISNGKYSKIQNQHTEFMCVEHCAFKRKVSALVSRCSSVSSFKWAVFKRMLPDDFSSLAT